MPEPRRRESTGPNPAAPTEAAGAPAPDGASDRPPPEEAAPETPASDPPASDTPASGAPAKPRRRQARGERRIAQLLDAAAKVFCASGYTSASTNAIAREAGVSPGTLYQFFPNKEAIAIELGGRLLEDWHRSHGAALEATSLDLPFDQMLDAVLDPLFAFNYENPAFAVLIHGPGAPGQITQEFEAIHASLLTRLEGIISSYLPDAPPAQLTLIANTSFAIFKAGLDLVLTHEGAEREAYATEVKRAMYRYLEPLFPEEHTESCASFYTP